MELAPVSIERDGDATIVITWTDGSVSRWTTDKLRRRCPCATCREKKKGENNANATDESKPLTLPVLSAAEAQPLTIESMNPVGHYAYNIAFSDGHNSGIYPFELLRDDD